MRSRWVILLALLLVCVSNASAVVITKMLLGTTTTVLSAELNNLPPNAYSPVSGVFNNTIGGGQFDGYTLCDVEFVGTFAAAPQAGSSLSVWFLKTVDGSNYENTPTASVALGRGPNVVLPVTSGQTGTRVVVQVLLPPGNFKVSARNDGTGQALAASGNTVKIRPVTPEGV